MATYTTKPIQTAQTLYGGKPNFPPRDNPNQLKDLAMQKDFSMWKSNQLDFQKEAMAQNAKKEAMAKEAMAKNAMVGVLPKPMPPMQRLPVGNPINGMGGNGMMGGGIKLNSYAPPPPMGPVGMGQKPPLPMGMEQKPPPPMGMGMPGVGMAKGFGMKKGGAVKAKSKGAKMSSASKRGDGIAQRGKTRGRMV